MTLTRVFIAGPESIVSLSLRLFLISTIVSSERSLLDFGIALSTAGLTAVTMKSAYLSRSLVDVSPEKSSEPEAALGVDSNTSL